MNDPDTSGVAYQNEILINGAHLPVTDIPAAEVNGPA